MTNQHRSNTQGDTMTAEEQIKNFKTQFNLRLTIGEMQIIQKFAEDNHTSVTQVIREAINGYIGK